MKTLARGRLWAWVLLVAPLVGGCAVHTGHTIAPYGQQPAEGRKLEELAIRECHAAHHAQPPFSFTTDGCSSWPDSEWVDCCVVHDRAYWCGGTFSERVAADRALQACVEQSGHGFVAFLMRGGVFVGGTQFLPTPYRWAYGWPYPSGASPE